MGVCSWFSVCSTTASVGLHSFKAEFLKPLQLSFQTDPAQLISGCWEKGELPETQQNAVA